MRRWFQVLAAQSDDLPSGCHCGQSKRKGFRVTAAFLIRKSAGASLLHHVLLPSPTEPVDFEAATKPPGSICLTLLSE
jgi:hypothetical protein